MGRAASRVGCGLLLVVLASCGSLRRGGKGGEVEQGEERPPHGQVEGDVVGRVELVRELEGFVLWASPGRVGLRDGAELVARPAGQAEGGARLTLSPERQGHLHTADIVAGRPAVGDLVLVGAVGEEPGPGPGPTEAVAGGEGAVASGGEGGEILVPVVPLAAETIGGTGAGGEAEGGWERPDRIEVEDRPDLAPVPMSVLETPGGLEAWRGR